MAQALPQTRYQRQQGRRPLLSFLFQQTTTLTNPIMSAEKQNPIAKYFSEFKVLRDCSKEFWYTNFIQFFDGLSYFTLIIVFTLFLKDYCVQYCSQLFYLCEK